MSLCLFVLLLCIISASHSVKIKNATDGNLKPANLTKPETRSIQSAFLFFARAIPDGFKKSFLKDLVLEIIDPGPTFKCNRSEDIYYLIRGVLAEKLLKQNTRTYKDFSVVSSKEKQPLLYQPLLDPSIPSSSDVRFIENPLPTSGHIEDHNLKYINSCLDGKDPEALDSKFYTLFTTVILPNFPDKIQKLFNMVLRERHKLKDMYKLMQKLAANRVTHPTFKKVNSIIRPAIDDMYEVKRRAEVNCKLMNFFDKSHNNIFRYDVCEQAC